MARLPRISPVDIAVHIIQRGNNRQVCFVPESANLNTAQLPDGQYFQSLGDISLYFKVPIRTFAIYNRRDFY